jgi:hypothetical protein
VVDLPTALIARHLRFGHARSPGIHADRGAAAKHHEDVRQAMT